MWIMTTFGFFSIVQKPGDRDLTIRARAEGDLEQLRTKYLPSMGEILKGGGTNYQYRARATHQALGQALMAAAQDIEYGDFGAAVAECQGRERAAIYSKAGSGLRNLAKLKSPEVIANEPAGEGLLAQFYDAIRRNDAEPVRDQLASNGKTLLKSGKVSGYGSAWGPLHIAAHAGALETLRLLLSYDMAPDSPLRQTSEQLGTLIPDIGRLLPLPQTPLGAAASEGHAAVVRELLRAGASPDGLRGLADAEPPEVGIGTPAWNSPLAWSLIALHGGKPEADCRSIVEMLLDAGADPSRPMRLNRWYGTPLAFAWRVLGDGTLSEVIAGYGAHLFTESRATIRGAIRADAHEPDSDLAQFVCSCLCQPNYTFDWGVPLAPFLIYTDSAPDRDGAIKGLLEAEADPTLVWDHRLYAEGQLPTETLKSLTLDGLALLLDIIDDPEQNWPSDDTIFSAWESSPLPLSLSKAGEMVKRAKDKDISHVGMQAVTPKHHEVAWELSKLGFEDQGAWGYVRECGNSLFLVAQFLHDSDDRIRMRLQNKLQLSKPEFLNEHEYALDAINEKTIREFIDDSTETVKSELGAAVSVSF